MTPAQLVDLAEWAGVTPESRPDEARDASEIPMLIAGFAIGVGIGAALLAVAWLILEAVGA